LPGWLEFQARALHFGSFWGSPAGLFEKGWPIGQSLSGLADSEFVHLLSGNFFADNTLYQSWC
jgi:hypothetical protein